MNNSKSLRVISTCIALTLFVTAMNGCGSKPEPSQALAQSTQAAAPAGASGKVSDKPITVSLFLQDRPEAAINNDLPIIKEITKKTNVSFNFIPGPVQDDQFREKFNVIIASGDIPDVMVNNNIPEMFKVAERGIFEQLDTLIDANAPNLKKLMAANPNYIKDIRLNNGKNYFLPFLGAVKTFKVFMLRQDWLEKLNIKSPETLDDWYTMLKAFKEKDPNGNGKQDEIPFSTRNSKKGILTFMEAYGLSGFEDKEQFFIEDNKVKFAYTDPRFKQALTYLNKLYKEGLIDAEYPTNNLQVWQSRFANELSGATVDVFVRIDALENATKPANPKANMIAVAPPKGPTGIQMTTSQQMPVRGVTAISAKSKYKTELVKLFDYFYSEEGNLLSNFGVEGDTFTMVNGQPKYTDKIVKDTNGRTALQMLYAMGHREWAYKQDIRYENVLVGEKTIKYRDEMTKYIKPAIPALAFTAEERNTLNSKFTEIQTYKEEMVDKLIMGKEPLDKFDDFVKKIEGMGMKDVLKIQQDAFDRYNK